MKREKTTQNIVIAILALSILALASWILFYHTNIFVKIPQSVQDSYNEVTSRYAKYMGSSLMKCDSDKGMIYVVSGSGGYTGISNYFDLSGNKIGSFEYSDLVFGAEPKPPVEVTYSSCKTLKSNNVPEYQK